MRSAPVATLGLLAGVLLAFNVATAAALALTPRLSTSSLFVYSGDTLEVSMTVDELDVPSRIMITRVKLDPLPGSSNAVTEPVIVLDGAMSGSDGFNSVGVSPEGMVLGVEYDPDTDATQSVAMFRIANVNVGEGSAIPILPNKQQSVAVVVTAKAVCDDPFTTTRRLGQSARGSRELTGYPCKVVGEEVFVATARVVLVNSVRPSPSPSPTPAAANLGSVASSTTSDDDLDESLDGNTGKAIIGISIAVGVVAVGIMAVGCYVREKQRREDLAWEQEQEAAYEVSPEEREAQARELAEEQRRATAADAASSSGVVEPGLNEAKGTVVEESETKGLATPSQRQSVGIPPVVGASRAEIGCREGTGERTVDTGVEKDTNPCPPEPGAGCGAGMGAGVGAGTVAGGLAGLGARVETETSSSETARADVGLNSDAIELGFNGPPGELNGQATSRHATVHAESAAKKASNADTREVRLGARRLTPPNNVARLLVGGTHSNGRWPSGTAANMVMKPTRLEDGEENPSAARAGPSGAPSSNPLDGPPTAKAMDDDDDSGSVWTVGSDHV